MDEMENKVKDILNKYNQQHIINWMNKVTEDEKRKIEEQVLSYNFEKLNDLYNLTKQEINIKEDIIEHIKYTDINKLNDNEFKMLKSIGEDIIKKNKYAVVTMAGGQGTRLGHTGPKGTYKINTINGEKYLFQIIVESLLKAKKKYNVVIPWYVMTSEENDTQTQEFLKENNFFGYPKEGVNFFKQGKAPLLSTEGKLIINSDKTIKEASDGNGSIYKSLKRNDALNVMKKKGIEWIFIGGVDNILLKIVDPLLTGITIEEKNLIASKSVVKTNPHEKVGVFCKANGKPKVIEYTELPIEMAEEIDENGELVYGEVNIASHLFNIKALEKLADQDLPYHIAFKKSNYLDESGNLVIATEPNVYKFEAFIFDGFAYYDDMSILRVKREEEFAPIKNATGNDSPETATNLYNKANEKN